MVAFFFKWQAGPRPPACQALDPKKGHQIFLMTSFFAVWTGLEPATSGVTGRHSNQTELPDQNDAVLLF